jgi:excisionase family DNA binding protein
MTTATHTPERVYTVEQVADHLAMHTSGVYRLVQSGDLRSVRAGRLIRIPASALDEFLAGPTEPTSPDAA